jgi:hypothetical protein
LSCKFSYNAAVLTQDRRIGSRRRELEQGCQIFFVQHTKTGKNVPNDNKYTKWPQKCSKWSYNRPDGHKIYQHLSLLDPPKFTQIGIFGLKAICYLATLSLSSERENDIKTAEKAGFVLKHHL